MASFIYNYGKRQILKGVRDLTIYDIKVALVTSSYTPDKDNHDFFDDITNEVVGEGYTAGGQSLANVAVNLDAANDRAELDADDATWSAATITARAAIIYRNAGTPSTSPLLAYVDFVTDYSTSGVDFTIEWDSEGILYLGE